MQVGAFRESFYGDHVSTMELSSEHKARQSALSIDKYRARATVAGATRFLSAGKPEILTDDINDTAVRGNIDMGLCVIQSKRDLQ